jgi:haloalkane dehalogenase
VSTHTTTSQAAGRPDPGGIARELYPFTSRFFDRGDGIRMHYVDEGPRDGSTVVFVHGNPSWSFYFRDLIRAVSPTHRAIAVDHVGCGLSDKPTDERYRYTLASRIDDLEALLEHAGVTGDVTLVVHDWGGAIGMGWAVRHPERITRLVVLNTAAFHLPRGKALPGLLWLARDTAFGAFLVERFNAFAIGASLIGTPRRPMAKEVKQGYLAPYARPGDRLATLRFVQDIPLSAADEAWAPLMDIEAKLPTLADKPMLICWGEKDFVFDDHFLREWQRRFPKAEVHAYPSAGHYVLEDAGDLIVPLVRAFLQRGPTAPVAGVDA